MVRGCTHHALPREGSAKQCQEQPAEFDPERGPRRVYGPGEPSRVQRRRRYTNSCAVESLNYARSGGTAASPVAVPRPEQGIKEAEGEAGVGGAVLPTIQGACEIIGHAALWGRGHKRGHYKGKGT